MNSPTNPRTSPVNKNTPADIHAKEIWKAGTMLFPVPVILVSCADKTGKPNVLTVAWTGTVCSDPPMVSISVRKERHSFPMLMESREFVVNIPTAELLRSTDYCGVASGRDVDKFAVTGLTPGPASKVSAPLLRECPINLECVVRRTMDLGSHTLFIAEVLAVQVTKRLILSSGRLAVERAGLVSFAHGAYYQLGRKLGFYGFSVEKPKTAKIRRKQTFYKGKKGSKNKKA